MERKEWMKDGKRKGKSVKTEVSQETSVQKKEIPGELPQNLSDFTLFQSVMKNKEAHEESGSKILYLALGFLKWYTREDGAEHYAPLVLQPVLLKKSKGGAGYAVALTDEEPSVNSTLLEYLKQEFRILNKTI